MVAEHDMLADELVRAVELLADLFAAPGVRYALVGGLATALRGRPRFTQDVNIWLDVSQIALPGFWKNWPNVVFSSTWKRSFASISATT